MRPLASAASPGGTFARILFVSDPNAHPIAAPNSTKPTYSNAPPYEPSPNAYAMIRYATAVSTNPPGMSAGCSRDGRFRQ
jgi:hypothetical protein